MTLAIQNVDDVMRDRIQSRYYQVGQMLPSERALAENLGVERRTVQMAIRQLAIEGLLEVQPRCRPVVSSRTPQHCLSRLVALVMWHSAENDSERAEQQRVYWSMSETLGRAGYYGVCIDAGERSTGTYPDKANREAELLKYVLDGKFGGLVFYPQACNSNRDLVREISQLMPLVLIDRLMPGVQADFVGLDNRKSAAEATRHLIEKGHKRIAFLSTGECINTVEEHFEGYSRALNEAFPNDPYEVILTPPLSHSRSWPVLDAIFRLPKDERPTAIVCANSHLAVRAGSDLRELNFRVPEDVTLIDCDKIERTVRDGLTTVEQPYEEIGKVAAELILRRGKNLTSDFAHIELPMKHRCFWGVSQRDSNLYKVA